MLEDMLFKERPWKMCLSYHMGKCELVITNKSADIKDQQPIFIFYNYYPVLFRLLKCNVILTLLSLIFIPVAVTAVTTSKSY